MAQHHVKVGGFSIGNDLPLVMIAGPCAMESRDHALEMASALKDIYSQAGMDFIFKSSFDKANRTSASGKRGVPLDYALKVFSEIKEKLGVPVITDVHEKEQCAPVAEVVDILQIPAFLCRQTDLVVAAAATGKPVNIKKGQFLAPWDMKQVAGKAESTGNRDIILTDRGTLFGYNNLVVDMRSFPIMAQTGYPVIFDATHAVQLPGGQGACSGGQREYAPVLARAAVAAGVAGVFVETHQDPDNAPCDGPNMIRLSDMPALISSLAAIDRLVKTTINNSK